jgi:hypothetical protein
MLIVRAQGSWEADSLLDQVLCMPMVSWTRGRFYLLFTSFYVALLLAYTVLLTYELPLFSYRYVMPVEEAAELARRAIYQATFRDGASGGCVSGMLSVYRSLLHDISCDNFYSCHVSTFHTTVCLNYGLDSY